MIISLPDKNLELNFPDDMPMEQIREAIMKNFYPEKLAKPSTTPSLMPTEQQGQPASPFPEADWVNRFSDLSGLDKGTVKYAPEIGFAAGSMIPGIGVVTGPLVAGLGSVYQQTRQSLASQPQPSGRPSLSLSSPFPEANQMEMIGASDIKPGEVGKEIGLGSVGNVIGGAVSAATPVAKGVLQEAAQAYGLPQLAYKAQPWIENFVNLTPGGKWLVEKYKKNLYNWSMQERDNILKEFSQNLPPEIDVATDVGEFVKGIAGRHKIAYDDFVKAGTTTTSQTPSARELLSEIKGTSPVGPVTAPGPNGYDLTNPHFRRFLHDVKGEALGPEATDFWQNVPRVGDTAGPEGWMNVPSKNPELGGKSYVEHTIDKYKQVWDQWKDELGKGSFYNYSKLPDGTIGVAPTKSELSIPLPNTREIAEQLKPEVSDKTKGIYNNLIKSGSLTTKEINGLMGGKQFGVDPATRESLKKALMVDLESFDKSQGTQLAVLKKSADDLYKELTSKWMENPSYRLALQAYEPSMVNKPFLPERPDLVLNRLFESSKIDKVKEVLDAMPKELKDMSIAKWLEGKIQTAMNTDETIIRPLVWQKMFETGIPGKVRPIGRVLEELAPDVYQRAKTWTDIMHQAGHLFPESEVVKRPFEKLTSNPLSMSLGLGASIGGARVMAQGRGEVGPEFFMGVAALNGLPMIMAYSFLGPAGKALIRRAAASAPARTAIGVGSLLGGDQIQSGRIGQAMPGQAEQQP